MEIEEIVKGVVGIILAVALLGAFIPVVNQLTATSNIPGFSFFNLLLPLVIFIIFLRFVKEVFNL